MGRWSKDGVQIATTLFEAVAWKNAIKVVCACGHSATFNPHGVWWRFHRKGWNDHFSEARSRFWCRVCGWRTGRKVRPFRLELARESLADVQLPLPDEREWKRAISRFRS